MEAWRPEASSGTEAAADRQPAQHLSKPPALLASKPTTASQGQVRQMWPLWGCRILAQPLRPSASSQTAPTASIVHSLHQAALFASEMAASGR